MKKIRISVLLSIAMISGVLGFILYALQHPEASFAEGTETFAAVYIVVMILVSVYAIVQIRRRN